MLKTTRVVITIVVLALVLMVLSLKLVVEDFFNIRDLSCTLADNQACPIELVAPIQEDLLGKSIFFTDLEMKVSELMADSQFELESVSKQLPGILNLGFIRRQPLYLLEVEAGRQYAILDRGLLQTVVDPNKVTSLPIIKINSELANSEFSSINEGRLDSETHNTIVSLLSSLEDLGLSSSYITLFDNEVIALEVDDNLTALVDSEQTINNLTKLKIILTELDFSTIDLAINEIDLRYKLVVLRTRSSLPSAPSP